MSGCGDGNAPPEKAVVQTSVEVEPSQPEDESTKQAESEVSEEIITVDAEPAEEVAATAPPPHRIMLLARGGPLLVDVRLTIDGQPIGEGIEALIDRVIQAGDTDGDGSSTWSEWRANTEFLKSDLVNMESMQQRTIKNWVESYDENADGRMQRAEVAAWLGRDGGRSASALRVRSRRSYLAQGASQSRLWTILDNDADGRLSSDELGLVAERLLLLDTSDDRIVDQSELASLRDQLSGQSGQRPSYDRQSRRDAAVQLRSSTDARDLDYLLSDLYAPRQQIGPTSFPNRGSLFDALDADEDDELSADELAALVTLPPHLELAIDFGAQPESSATNSPITILQQASEIEQVRRTSANRFVIETQDSRLVVSIHELSQGTDNSQALLSSQISLMVHDRSDTLFECLDGDSNGKLGEREIEHAAHRLREADWSGDGQLDASELPYSLTVAFMRGEAQGERSFYVPRIEPEATSYSDSPPWFLHADLNGDGDISRTEFLGSTEQFQVLDKDLDEFISASEAANSSRTNTTPGMR